MIISSRFIRLCTGKYSSEYSGSRGPKVEATRQCLTASARDVIHLKGRRPFRCIPQKRSLKAAATS